jgi:hypothetical protein
MRLRQFFFVEFTKSFSVLTESNIHPDWAQHKKISSIIQFCGNTVFHGRAVSIGVSLCPVASGEWSSMHTSALQLLLNTSPPRAIDFQILPLRHSFILISP